jgi:hypothetical protein
VNKISKYLILVLVLCTVMITILPTVTLANSAEPPSLIILTNNPPDDLSIVLISDNNQPEAIVRRVAWEGYYVFYSADLKASDKYSFKVTTKGESFECTLDTPLQGYNNVFTLDMSNRKLTPGKYPLRSVLLVSIRLLLTLLIEGIIFWLFRYKQKRSWIVFLAINLITQGLLNIWLSGGKSPLQSYLILVLFMGELFVFIAEMIAFPIFIKEHKKRRAFAYAFIANFISLIAGTYFITLLPV